MLRPPSPVDRPPTVQMMRRLGLEPDPWQVDVLQTEHPQILLNCCRQAGKSTVVAILGLVEALFRPMTRVVLVSRSHRQSRELLRVIAFFFELLRQPLKKRVSAQEIELNNLSRIVCVPCRADTIRGYAQVDLLVIDEAAQVPDDLYRTVRPMLAVSKGRLICLSTPFGKRGFFWDAWARGGDDWMRIEIPASMCPRIAPEFLEREKRGLGEAWFRQEYFCSFESVEGLVYPDFAKCVAPANSAAANAPPAVGGMDFGFRNPFAAIWGHVDHDGVLWLTGEHYARQKPLSYHAQKLPAGVMWYADPAGASEIAELQIAGLKIRRAHNAKRTGIMAVSARLQSGTLRVLEGRCPNLLAEAGLYRYGDGEAAIDEHNHALDALRYLISRLDARKMAGVRTELKESIASEKKSPIDPRIHAEDDDSGFWIPLRW